MKKSMLFALSAVMAITILSMTFTSCAAISYVPGVTAGQAITYSHVEDADPAVQETIHVKAVSGSIVNYTWQTSAHVVEYNVSYVVQSPWYFVGINLNVSDPVHGGLTGYPVTSLVPAYSAAGQTWSAVRMQYSGGGITRDAYWERSTGIMLYWSYSSVSMEQTYTIVSIGSDTTDDVPMDPTFIIASLLAGVIVAVISMRNKRRTG